MWRTDEGVTVRPFYRAGDLAQLSSQIGSQPGEFPFTRGAGRPPSFETGTLIDGDAIRADLLHDAGATDGSGTGLRAC